MDIRIVAFILAAALIATSTIGLYNYTVLRSQVEEAYTLAQDYAAKCQQLEQEIVLLQQQLEDLKAANQEALEKLKIYEEENKRLAEELDTALRELSATKALLLEKEETIQNLQAALAELEQKIQEQEAKIQEFTLLLEKTSYWYEPWGGNTTFLDKLLRDSAAEVNNIAQTLIRPWQDGEELSRLVFLHIAENLMYAPDPYARVPTPAGLVLSDEMIQPANETFYKGWGADEDLAVYAYSLIYSVKQDSIRMYLVTLEYEDYWTALIIEAGDGAIIILDPALNYATGNASTVLQAQDLTLNPLAIARDAKQELLDNGATVSLQGEITPASPAEAIAEWLSALGRGDPARIYIDGVGVHESFDNVESLIAFLEGGVKG